MTTKKSEIWRAALLTLATDGKVSTQAIDVDAHPETIGGTLKEMEELDLLTRDSPRAHNYEIGPVLQLISNSLADPDADFFPPASTN